MHVGKGKVYPEGPVCYVRGIEIKCYITCSPEGGITPNILVDILAYLDQPNLFWRTNNSMPHLVYQVTHHRN